MYSLSMRAIPFLVLKLNPDLREPPTVKETACYAGCWGNYILKSFMNVAYTQLQCKVYEKCFSELRLMNFRNMF